MKIPDGIELTPLQREMYETIFGGKENQCSPWLFTDDMCRRILRMQEDGKWFGKYNTFFETDGTHTAQTSCPTIWRFVSFLEKLEAEGGRRLWDHEERAGSGFGSGGGRRSTSSGGRLMSLLNPAPDKVRCCADTEYLCTIQGAQRFHRCARAGRYVLPDDTRYRVQHYRKLLQGKIKGGQAQNICPACHQLVQGES